MLTLTVWRYSLAQRKRIQIQREPEYNIYIYMTHFMLQPKTMMSAYLDAWDDILDEKIIDSLESSRQRAFEQYVMENVWSSRQFVTGVS